MFTTITQAERDELGVSQLPDSPQITAARLKELFDSLGNLAIDKFITHIEEISANTAAGNIGVTVPEGYSAVENMQSLIDEIVLKLNETMNMRHTHANKDTLDAITSEIKTGYDNIVALLAGINTIQNNLSDSAQGIPNAHAVVDYVRTQINNAPYVKPTQLTDAIYPVGTVYQTTSASFDPSSKFGGVWSLRSTVSGVKSFERTA